jgi:hypothetical protein
VSGGASQNGAGQSVAIEEITQRTTAPVIRTVKRAGTLPN